MLATLQSHRQLEELLDRQGGILLNSDLEAFWGNRSTSSLHTRIDAWIAAGYLRRVCRGVYVGQRFDPWNLASHMFPDAAISTVSVLARAALIGTAPSEQVWAVRLGRSRDISTGRIAVHAWTLDPSLMNFGLEREGPLLVATPEKAFLDTLHFHMHGRRFPFAIEDIDTSRLDSDRLDEYLRHYKNLRFRTFVRGVLAHGR
jgi:hypothetical protein